MVTYKLSVKDRSYSSWEITDVNSNKITLDINPIEAMIGCKKSVQTIAGVQLDLDIRAGIESGAEFASHGNGFPNVNNPHIKGRFVSVIRIRTPSVTDPVLVEQLKTLNDAINKAP